MEVARFGDRFASETGIWTTGKRNAARKKAAGGRAFPAALPYWIAMIHAVLYAKDQASLARPRLPGELGVMVFLKIDPRLDNLQSDPRYKDLLRRMKHAR